MSGRTTLNHSTVLDAFGWQQSKTAQIATLAANTNPTAVNRVFTDLYGASPSDIGDKSWTVKVALTVRRANDNDPAELLNADWATRSKALADQATIWNTYGANPAIFEGVKNEVRRLLGPAPLLDNQEYISKPASRTIWLSLNAEDFGLLFGVNPLLVKGDKHNGDVVWKGLLSLPDSIRPHIRGIWIGNGYDIKKPNLVVSEANGVDLPEGPVSTGGAATTSNHATPVALANYYNYPLMPAIPVTGPLVSSLPMPTVALVESRVPDAESLRRALNDYRAALGLTPFTQDQFDVVTGIGTATSDTNLSELTLDLSVVAGAAPGSPQLIYASGGAGPTFVAYQQAFFDSVRNPTILSSSFNDSGQASPDSPFLTAWNDLFIDGALSQVAVHVAAGDTGSTGGLALGVPHVRQQLSPSQALVVSGTSISNRGSAEIDRSLNKANGILDQALANDPATLIMLARSGLKTLPSTLGKESYTLVTAPKQPLQGLLEAVWNGMVVSAPTRKHLGDLNLDLGGKNAGTGGVNTTSGIPWFQSAFGLTPTASGPIGGTGRGVPDVAAMGGANTLYAALAAARITDPKADLAAGESGTSAAAPPGPR